MKQALLITAITILYYTVLIYFDRKRRAAFKAKKQMVFGKTTGIKDLEKSVETVVEEEPPSFAAFGHTNLNVSEDSQLEQLKLSMNTDLSQHTLEQDMEELAMDLAAEQTLETPKDNLAQLAATNQTEINQKTIAGMMATIKRKL
ncbi:MAG: hypothetical protein AAF960_22525 [Bacteroidota bacterium]